MEMQFLTLSDVKMIHDNQIHKHGGLPGLRDEKLLHPDIYHMAAAYMCAIIKNHPFLDANKRTGLLTALIFLKFNGIIIEVQKNELFNLTMAVTQSHITEQEIAIFFKQNTII